MSHIGKIAGRRTGEVLPGKTTAEILRGTQVKIPGTTTVRISGRTTGNFGRRSEANVEKPLSRTLREHPRKIKKNSNKSLGKKNLWSGGWRYVVKESVRVKMLLSSVL